MTTAPLPGLVLAAGGGTRYGGPKALARTADGESWLARAVATLLAAGVDPVTVVLGAAPEAAELLSPDTRVVVAEGWEQGLGTSLRAGLLALDGPGSGEPREAVLVTLVDLPGMSVQAVRRVAAEPVTFDTLRQAVYDGRPGHPVLIGRSHWPTLVTALAGSSEGDRGARPYLVRAGVEEVECGDLWSGRDVDVPEEP